MARSKAQLDFLHSLTGQPPAVHDPVPGASTAYHPAPVPYTPPVQHAFDANKEGQLPEEKVKAARFTKFFPVKR